MKSIEKISIIGAGAVGASYASMLHAMSKDSVSFIAGKTRYRKLSEHGVIVNGKQYAIPVYQPRRMPEPQDLIIIAVKHHHLNEALNDLDGSVGNETTLLSFMNGIGSEEAIGALFGRDKVLFSIVLGIDAVRHNNVTSYSSQGRVFFGEARNDGLSQKVLRVKSVFERAGINYVVPDDMIRTLWWKFMINVGINQVSAVLRLPYRHFQRYGEPRSLMDSAMREVMLVAQSKGIDLSENDIENWHNVLSCLSPDGKTSMLQDVEAGRKTEAEMFAGKVIELGDRLNIPTPVNEMLFKKLREMEEN